MRKLDNTKLDEIGRALVKASALPARDIERIVADKALFDSVRKRIAVETTTKTAARPRMGARLLATAASVLLIAVVTSFVVFRSKPVDVTAVQPVAVPETPLAKRFTQPDRIVDTKDLPQPVSLPRIEKISSARPDVKPNRSKQSAVPKAGSEGDFYALSYAGDPNETERGSRIVRMDIPRTVLFAMGVDIPLENETETVKADLLIGSDGVTRAIRVVK